jgi:hypothetical protein
VDLDLLGDRSDPLHPPCGTLGGRFLGVARHRAGKRDDPSVGGHADMGGVEGRLELKLVEDIALQFQIIVHERPLRQRDAFNTKQRLFLGLDRNQ